MPYDIPRPYGYRIQPFKLQDDEALVASLANQLLKARLAEARAAARGGGGGGRGGSGKEKKGKGAWVMTFNKDTGRYEKQWVEGSTEKERKITMKAEAFNETLDRLGQNPEVSKLLGALRNPGASNLTKREALKKLTDLKRDPAFSDLDSAGVDEAFAKFTGPDAAAVQEEKKKIDSSSTAGTLVTSLQNAWDRLTTTVGTFGKSDAEKIAASKASSERQARRREADPWLREQDLREQEEQEMNRGWYEKAGGVGGALTNAADTILSDPGMDTALAATALAATAPVSVPLAAATTGLAVAGGMLSGDTIFRERLANDPNLTDAQKAEAYGEGAFREQAIGGALNAMPSILGRVGPMVRASRAARGLEGTAAQTARAESLAKVAPRFKYDMPLVAGEGAVVNAGQMLASNQNYGAVTNQDVDLSEGVGEAALMGLAFGLASGAGSGVSAWRGARARRRMAQQAKADQQTPEAVQSDAEADKGAEEILNAKDKKASESQPAAAKPDEGGQTPPDAGAPASPVPPVTPPEGPAPAGEAAAQPVQPSAARPAEPQPSAAQAAPQAPDLPAFKKSEAKRQREARGFEEDLGEEFEAKFRASKEYEGYARYDALRRSYENSGAASDAEQASLNANIARADEGRRLWRERFILDNWKEASAADKAAKAAKKAAAQREAEVQVAQEAMRSDRFENPVAMPSGNRSDVGRTSRSTWEWTPRPLEAFQPRPDRHENPVAMPAGKRSDVGRSTPSSWQLRPVRLEDFVQTSQVQPEPAAANASLQQAGAVPGRPMSKQEAVQKLAAVRGKKPAKPDLPFSDKDLRTISTYASKPTDKGKNALIQKNPQFADDNALEKLRITRDALQNYGQKTYNRMNVEKLIKSIDELSARVRTLRGENEPGGNAGSEPSAALGYAGRRGEEVPHPENSGNDSQMAADTSADTGASPRESAEEVRVRRAKNQGKRDGRRPGERSAETPHSEGSPRAEGDGRQPRGEEPVGKSGSEQPAETSARAGEGERSAESETDAVAGSAADRRSPAEKVADFSRLADRSRKAVVSAVGRASLNRMGAALNSLAKRGFTSVDDVLELRNHIEGNLDAYVELGTVKGDAAGDTIIDGFDRVLDYMKGRRAADEAKASVRAERASRAEERTLAETMSPGTFAASRVREYLEGLNYRHAVPRNGVEAPWRDLPADSDALAKALRNHLLDEDYNEYATNSEVQSAIRANFADAAYDVLNAAYHAARDGAKGARFRSGAEADRALTWKNEGFDLQFFRDNFDIGSIDRLSPNLKRAEVVSLVDPEAASRFGEDIVDGTPLCTV